MLKRKKEKKYGEDQTSSKEIITKNGVQETDVVSVTQSVIETFLPTKVSIEIENKIEPVLHKEKIKKCFEIDNKKVELLTVSKLNEKEIAIPDINVKKLINTIQLPEFEIKKDSKVVLDSKTSIVNNNTERSVRLKGRKPRLFRSPVINEEIKEILIVLITSQNSCMEIKNIEILLIEGSDIKKIKNQYNGVIPEELIYMNTPIDPVRQVIENMVNFNTIHILTETSNIFCYKILEPHTVKKYNMHMTKVDYAKTSGDQTKIDSFETTIDFKKFDMQMEIHFKGERVVEFKNQDYKISESYINTNRVISSNYSSNYFIEYQMQSFESEGISIYTFDNNVWSIKIKELIISILKEKGKNNFVIQKQSIKIGIESNTFSIWEMLQGGGKIYYLISKESSNKQFSDIINKDLIKMFPNYNISVICAFSSEYPGVVKPHGFSFSLLKCKEDENPLKFFNFLI